MDIYVYEENIFEDANLKLNETSKNLLISSKSRLMEKDSQRTDRITHSQQS